MYGEPALSIPLLSNEKQGHVCALCFGESCLASQRKMERHCRSISSEPENQTAVLSMAAVCRLAPFGFSACSGWCPRQDVYRTFICGAPVTYGEAVALMAHTTPDATSRAANATAKAAPKPFLIMMFSFPVSLQGLVGPRSFEKIQAFLQTAYFV